MYCKALEVFESGRVRVSDETAVSLAGDVFHMIVYFAPLFNDQGEVEHIVELSADIEESSRFQKEFNILFEKTPSFITIIDKKFNIIRANEKFRNTFGNIRNKKCFEAFKRKRVVCQKCPARETFETGADSSSLEAGVSSSGDDTRYMVTTTPIAYENGKVSCVMEICTDITELAKMQTQIHQTQEFHSKIIRNSSQAIISINKNGTVQIFNDAARQLLNWQSHKKPGRPKIKEMLPKEFFNMKNENRLSLPETQIIDDRKRNIPVKFYAISLISQNSIHGKVAFIQDLREIKALEEKKIKIEKMSSIAEAVGRFENKFNALIDALDFGLNIFEEARKNNDPEQFKKGLKILKKHRKDAVSFIDSLLFLSKFDSLKQANSSLVKLVNKTIESFAKKSRKYSDIFEIDIQKGLEKAYLDKKAIRKCLTEIISNSIDAIGKKDLGKDRIRISVFKDDSLVIEVSDNGPGIPEDIKKSLFKSIVTTKSKGSGLGLMLCQKIMDMHGGIVDVISESGKGTVVSLILPGKEEQ